MVPLWPHCRCISPSSARFQISGQQVQENHDFPNIENSADQDSITDSNDVYHSTEEMQLAHNFQSSETCAPLDTRWSP